MSPDTHWVPGCCFLSPRKCTKACTCLKTLYKSHTFTESFSSQGGVSRVWGPHRMAHLPFSTHGLFFIRSGFRKGSLGIPSSIHLRSLWVGRGG